jgi:hypothetical protein
MMQPRCVSEDRLRCSVSVWRVVCRWQRPAGCCRGAPAVERLWRPEMLTLAETMMTRQRGECKDG